MARWDWCCEAELASQATSPASSRQPVGTSHGSTGTCCLRHRTELKIANYTRDEQSGYDVVKLRRAHTVGCRCVDWRERLWNSTLRLHWTARSDSTRRQPIGSETNWCSQKPCCKRCYQQRTLVWVLSFVKLLRSCFTSTTIVIVTVTRASLCFPHNGGGNMHWFLSFLAKW